MFGNVVVCIVVFVVVRFVVVGLGRASVVVSIVVPSRSVVVS